LVIIARREAMTAKTKVTFVYTQEQVKAPCHFFATSAYEWRTDSDPKKLIDAMQKNGQTFDLWLVPAPETTSYKIVGYAPQVEGAQFLGQYKREA
jgi:hypothetical protein